MCDWPKSSLPNVDLGAAAPTHCGASGDLELDWRDRVRPLFCHEIIASWVEMQAKFCEEIFVLSFQMRFGNFPMKILQIK
jgi:hypothetical protein